MEFFWSDALKISVLLNPFAVLSTFIALAGEYGGREKRRILLITCLASMAAGTVMLFSGELLFSLLGINVDLFKAGGGVVLMVCAVSLVWGSEKGGRSAAAGDRSIAVVPLAIPMAVGPGTAAGLIVIGSEHGGSLDGVISNIGALAAGVAVLAAVMSLGVWADRMMSKNAISVITRLTGLFLSAIAAQMILSGVRGVLNA